MPSGMVATWSASCPSDIDFTCGFQESLSPGIRSSKRLVVAASCCSSFRMGSNILGSFPFESDDFGALGELRLRDVLIKPNLIPIRVHDGEGSIAPPLVRQWRGRLDLLPFYLLTVCLNIGHLQVQFDGTLRRGRGRTLHPVGGTHEHYPRAAERDSAEVEQPVFSQHSHDVPEAEFIYVEGASVVDRVNVNHCHQLRVLFHGGPLRIQLN